MRFLWIIALFSACSGDETISGFTDSDAVYELETLDGSVLGAPASIRFPGEGKVLGEGPCNHFSATQDVPYPWIRIGAVAATRAACPALQQEQQYFDALQAMTQIESNGPVVILSNEAGREMVFSARN